MLIRKKCFRCSQRLVICRLKTCFVGLLKKEKRPGIHRNLNNKGGIFFVFKNRNSAEGKKKMRRPRTGQERALSVERDGEVKTEGMKNK